MQHMSVSRDLASLGHLPLLVQQAWHETTGRYCSGNPGQARGILRCVGALLPIVKVRCNHSPDRLVCSNGGAGIRTQEGRKALTVFKTAAFVRSATPPKNLQSKFFGPRALPTGGTKSLAYVSHFKISRRCAARHHFSLREK